MNKEELTDLIFGIGLITLFILLIITTCYIHDNVNI
jgi:hypothetical protein